ncbi:hypothetical protein HMPREF9946_02561 [Acetobacteraceae bacterium AT-5844]|nr:hypothetical protein HMPREF9946_02561 [Acetobacteraceae bacterium AT-5844]
MPASTAYTIDQLFTMSRASKRTVVDGTGNLIEIANNTFGLTYDPVTLKPLGLLQEFTGLNYIRNPRGEGLTVGQIGSGGVAPTNWILQGSASPNTRHIVGSGVENGIPYVDVRFTSPGVSSGNALEIVFETMTGGAPVVVGDTVTVSAYISLQSGTIPTGTNLMALSISENDSTGLYLGMRQGYIETPPTGPLIRNRIERTQTMVAPTVAFARPLIRIHPGSGDAFDFVLRVGIPQLEKNFVASSPIMPNVGAPAAATRLYDSVLLDLTKSGFANMGSTIIWRGIMDRPLSVGGGVGGRGLFRFDDGTNNNYVNCSMNTGNAMTLRWCVDGVFSAVTLGNVVFGQEFRVAVTFGPNFIAGCMNNNNPVIGNIVGYPVGLNVGRLGADGNWGNNTLYGTTAQFDIIPRTVATAELATISA